MDVVTLSSIIGSSFAMIVIGFYMMNIEKEIEEKEDPKY